MEGVIHRGLRKPNSIIANYTMLYKYGKQTRDFWGVFILSLVYFSIL